MLTELLTIIMRFKASA